MSKLDGSVKRALWLGVALTFVGFLASAYVWSLGLLYDGTCHGRWEILPTCIELRATMQRWLLAPLPGLALVAFASTRPRGVARK